jgi:hypothetical protein
MFFIRLLIFYLVIPNYLSFNYLVGYTAFARIFYININYLFNSERSVIESHFDSISSEVLR